MHGIERDIKNDLLFVTFNARQRRDVEDTKVKAKFRHFQHHISTREYSFRIAHSSGDRDTVDGDEATPLCVWGVAGDCGGSTVVSDDGDGGAAQPDRDEKTSEVQADEGSDGRGRCAAGGHDAVAALRGGRGSDRGRGSPPRDGGSKGNEHRGDDDREFGEHV